MYVVCPNRIAEPSSYRLTQFWAVNDFRTGRVAEILDDFRTLQYYIASAPTEPPNSEDHYTEGWAALRQCAIDGQYILECAADTTVPTPGGGEEEQRKAELQQYVAKNRDWCPDATSTDPRRVLLDAYSRRHEGQKIYLRQAAAQRWIDWRNQVLQGGRPTSRNRSQLQACDYQLRTVNDRIRPGFPEVGI